MRGDLFKILLFQNRIVVSELGNMATFRRKKFPFRFKASKGSTLQAACLSTVDSAVASGDHFPKRRDKDYHDQNLGHEEAMLHSSSQKSFCKTLVTPFLVAVALWLNPATAQAGPCTADISQFEATVQQSASDPFAGLMARQSVDAQLGHQPTPESVHNSDQRVKSRFDAAMARAKRFDAQGNRPGCTRALNAAKKIYIP